MLIGIFDAYTHGKTGRKMNPIQCAFDIGKTVRDLAILRQDTKTDALDLAIEPSVGMAHEVHIDVCANGNALEFRLAIVGNDVPGPRINKREQWSAGMSVRT